MQHEQQFHTKWLAGFMSLKEITCSCSPSLADGCGMMREELAGEQIGEELVGGCFKSGWERIREQTVLNFQGASKHEIWAVI